MIKIENTDVYGWEAAIRGARNPMNSWDKSDSNWEFVEDPSIINPNDEVKLVLGPNDRKLLQNLANAGPDHGKFLRMITVSLDITAPLYWWKEFDTYKVGTVANSCSTMHKIHAKEFALDDFSHEHLLYDREQCWDMDVMAGPELISTPLDVLESTIYALNKYRERFLDTKDKRYWWQMIQLLPTSYNQRRTVLLNYQVLKTMYHARKHHKLDEWREFCRFIESMPYSELITGGSGE
jgi:hypothetical protein